LSQRPEPYPAAGTIYRRRGQDCARIVGKPEVIRAWAQFAVELHKLRKTGASRRYLAGVPLKTLMQELGHESLATTQKYLADVRMPGGAKKAVADAEFIHKPNVVKTGTDGD
jgi:integrase